MSTEKLVTLVAMGTKGSQRSGQTQPPACANRHHHHLGDGEREGLWLKWSEGHTGVLQGLNWAPVQSASAPRVTQSTLCPEGLKSEQATSTLLGKFN